MRSTVINSSKEMTAYSDFPPRPEYANYMHNRKLLEVGSGLFRQQGNVSVLL